MNDTWTNGPPTTLHTTVVASYEQQHSPWFGNLTAEYMKPSKGTFPTSGHCRPITRPGTDGGGGYDSYQGAKNFWEAKYKHYCIWKKQF